MQTPQRLRLLVGAAALALASMASAAQAGTIKNVVLVHGAFADGSGWNAVATILKRDGYNVTIVQQPLTSLADDVTATNRVLDQQDGPVILVGHSYGGAIITQAGNHASVKGLVYIAAFQPDTGENIGALLARTPPPTNDIKPTSDGFLFVDRAAFPVDFADDLPKAEAEFMAASEMPVAGKAFGEKIDHAAWRDKPSWALVATADRMIAPDLERFMTARAKSKTIEVPTSHAAFLSRPADVAKLIEEAAANAAS